jgi:hypothetical protein
MFILEFIERLIVFAANVGLPQGVSLFELISPIPNFRDALVSCSFSDGSLQSVADYVYKQKQSSETVREEITKLIKLAECQGSDITSCVEQDTGYADSMISLAQAFSTTSNDDDVVPSQTGEKLFRQRHNFIFNY